MSITRMINPGEGADAGAGTGGVCCAWAGPKSPHRATSTSSGANPELVPDIHNLVPKFKWKNWVLSKLSFLIGTARSRRIGPTGDFHETPTPAVARIAVESRMIGCTPPVDTSCEGVRTRF